MNETTTTLSAAAERMRRHRQRRRNGLRCLPVEISETDIEGLTRLGLLPAEMRNDLSAVVSALYKHLDHTLGLHVTNVTEY
jgi:hypothetical protein